MGARRKLLVGAWKAYLNHGEALSLAADLAKAIAGREGAGDLGFDLGVCPSFISIVGVQEVLAGTPVQVGAQSLFWESENGAFTSQITGEQVADLGCPLVILGHSELRALGETDADVNRRVRVALEKGIVPIICIGESMAERKSGAADARVAEQVLAAVEGLAAETVAGVVFAYEPIWAIKSRDNPEAVPATPEQANAMHRGIRDALGERFGAPVAEAVRVLYGGSVGPENAADFAGLSEGDGMLVGSASVKAEKFIGIVEAIERVS
jgi:triosephosphate isomerase